MPAARRLPARLRSVRRRLARDLGPTTPQRQPLPVLEPVPDAGPATGWTAELRSAVWVSETVLRVQGWAFARIPDAASDLQAPVVGDAEPGEEPGTDAARPDGEAGADSADRYDELDGEESAPIDGLEPAEPDAPEVEPTGPVATDGPAGAAEPAAEATAEAAAEAAAGDLGPELDVWLERAGHDGTPLRVRASVRALESAEVDAVVGDATHDRGSTAFVADLDLGYPIATVPDREYERTWTVRIARRLDGHRVGGVFTGRYGWGSAMSVPAQFVGKILLRPDWRAGQGLVVSVARRAALTTEVDVAGSTVLARVDIVGEMPTEVLLEESTSGTSVTGSIEVHETRRGHRPQVDVSVTVPDQPAPSRAGDVSWYLYLRYPDGDRRRLVHGGPEFGAAAWSRPPGTIEAHRGTRGGLRVEVAAPGVLVEDVDVDHTPEIPLVRVSGRMRGLSAAVTLSFDGARQRITAGDIERTGDRFTATFPLSVSPRWTGGRQLVGSGGFTLRALDGSSRWPVHPAPDLRTRLYRRFDGPMLNVRVERSPDDRIYLDIAPPVPLDHQGARGRARSAAAVSELAVIPGTVYVESFKARLVSCNPLPVQLELTRRRPDLSFTWGIRQRALDVPDGTRAVVQNTRDWWETRARAQVVVVNDWLNVGFDRKPGQTVVQTWHGTPLKKLGLDRPMRQGSRFPELVAGEVSNWSHLLAQSPWMGATMRGAYGLGDEVVVSGYPRNDVMAADDGTRRGQVRAQLGLRDGQTAVLYAPTWRENTKRLVGDLDLAAMVDRLGSDFAVLLRGHMNVRTGFAGLGQQIVDVSGYPDISDLFLAADVLVTDYSSVMFDYAVTGRPIIFFVPDLDEYRDTLRGLYFDLGPIAPGPLLQTTGEVVAAVRDLDGLQRVFADRYRAWQERFVPLDDGGATGRVVDLIEQDLDRL